MCMYVCETVLQLHCVLTSVNKVCELVTVQLLHTLLLIIIVAFFKVISLKKLYRCQHLVYSSKQLCNYYYKMMFRAVNIIKVYISLQCFLYL